jgi:excinuclease UvrABC nuclease subunit
MLRRMDFSFEGAAYDPTTFIADALPAIPKDSAVYRIFDTRGKLVVLDKTSDLHERLERYFSERTETVRDLDLRGIAGRIEYIRTASPFETAYLLYRERRSLFPKTYRKMRTFRYFTLMKINPRQRFPRIYAARQIKVGVEYLGPFAARGQFERMKTALERAFRLRPCLYNIRGGDPHPDCMYFQMHACSRPCNDDIDRAGYLADVRSAIAFAEGRDDADERAGLEVARLAEAMRFEEAEAAQRKLEKLRRFRGERRETFQSVWSFDYLAVLPAFTAARRRIAFIRQGHIAGFEEYETATLREALAADLPRYFEGPPKPVNREWQYDEFCLTANFLLNPLESVVLIPVAGRPAELAERVVAAVEAKAAARRRKRAAKDGAEEAKPDPPRPMP